MTKIDFIHSLKMLGLEPRTGKIPHLLDVYFTGKYGEELLVSSLHLGGVSSADLTRTLEWVVARGRRLELWR